MHNSRGAHERSQRDGQNRVRQSEIVAHTNEIRHAMDLETKVVDRVPSFSDTLKRNFLDRENKMRQKDKCET